MARAGVGDRDPESVPAQVAALDLARYLQPRESSSTADVGAGRGSGVQSHTPSGSTEARAGTAASGGVTMVSRSAVPPWSCQVHRGATSWPHRRSLEQSRNGTTSACGGSYLQEHARDRGRSITEVQATIDSSRTGTLCQIEPALAKTRSHIGADIHRGRGGLQLSTRTNGRTGKASSGACPLAHFGEPRLPSPGQLGNRLFCRAGAGIRSFFIQPSSSNSRPSATRCSAAS